MARVLVVTSGANVGQREFYKYEVFTCKLEARTAYGVPTSAAFTNCNLLIFQFCHFIRALFYIIFI